MPGMGLGSMSYPPGIGARPPDPLRIRPLASRMLGNVPVRFGGGRMEEEPRGRLAGRAPNSGGPTPGELGRQPPVFSDPDRGLAPPAGPLGTDSECRPEVTNLNVVRA